MNRIQMVQRARARARPGTKVSKISIQVFVFVRVFVFFFGREMGILSGPVGSVLLVLWFFGSIVGFRCYGSIIVWFYQRTNSTEPDGPESRSQGQTRNQGFENLDPGFCLCS
jgi:hypothetical protein